MVNADLRYWIWEVAKDLWRNIMAMAIDNVHIDVVDICRGAATNGAVGAQLS